MGEPQAYEGGVTFVPHGWNTAVPTMLLEFSAPLPRKRSCLFHSHSRKLEPISTNASYILPQRWVVEYRAIDLVSIADPLSPRVGWAGG